MTNTGRELKQNTREVTHSSEYPNNVSRKILLKLTEICRTVVKSVCLNVYLFCSLSKYSPSNGRGRWGGFGALTVHLGGGALRGGAPGD